MKSFYLTSALLLCILLLSCEKGDMTDPNQCAEMATHPTWKTETFKTFMTIQFPENYEGFGLNAWSEGNTFKKKRNDKKVEFSYEYCNLGCFEYGMELPKPIPLTITTKDKNYQDITLQLTKEFCYNGLVVGILYSNKSAESTGKYFMIVGNLYLEGLSIHYTKTEYQEVENIIKTIVNL